jgi:hypothetical protein
MNALAGQCADLNAVLGNAKDGIAIARGSAGSADGGDMKKAESDVHGESPPVGHFI